MMKNRWLGVLLVTLLAGVWSLAGTKEEIIRLQSDVLQMQQQVHQLQKSVDDGNGTLKTLLEQLIDETNTTNRALEQLIALARAQKDEGVRGVNELKQEFQTLSIKLDDTNNRLVGLYQKIEENQAKIESRRLSVPTEPGGPKPDQVYSLAYNDYLSGNYELAMTGFRDFLVTYPESEYADNAAYYLGVCEQVQGHPDKAIQAFDEVINLYPKGDLTPSAYYKKAQVQQEQQLNEDAIDTLKKLVTLFPESQEAVNAGPQLEKMGVDVSKLTRRRR